MTYSFRTNGNFIDFVHTDNTSLTVESVLRSLHNTSRAVDWSLPEDTTRISFKVNDKRSKCRRMGGGDSNTKRRGFRRYKHLSNTNRKYSNRFS